MRIVVVGGGISGLTAATWAKIAGHDVVCVERDAKPGGLIRSERHGGFLCELGPQAILDDAPATAALIAALGLEPRILRAAPEARRRFIYAGGALHALPMSPPALLRSRLLSPLGKLRLLGEPLVRARRADAGDDAETVAAFGARRLGREAGRVLLETAVIGIFAGAAGGLSAASALPRLVAFEREHGSLLRGVLAGRKRGKRPGHPVSLPDGLGELPAALTTFLGGSIRQGEVVALASPAPGRWRVSLGDGPATALEADAVVLATEADVAARLLAPMAPPAAGALTDLATAPIALCCLGFSAATAETLGMDLAAYGFLVARGEQPKLLGCQYESSTFAGRAPEGGVLLRAILGGVGPGFEPDIVDRTDDEIAARACADLRTIAGLKRDPDSVRVVRYARGIPQMAPGHAARVATLDAALATHPGLSVLGHALRGVGVNESIRAATALARERFGAPAA